MKNLQPTLLWIARILSMAFVGMILLFIFGEGLDPTTLTLREWIGFLFFPFAFGVGLVVGWWKQGLGGSIALGSLIGFYVVYGLMNCAFPRGWAFAACALPALLLLASSLVSRTARDARP
jgi:hypothetical protein